MTTATLPATCLDRAAIASIDAYQRHLSPHKGFRCAHRVLHGGRSCSQFAKRVLLRGGLTLLMRLLPGRFDRCASAARALKSQRVLEYESKTRPAPAPGAPKAASRSSSPTDQCVPADSCDSVATLTLADCGAELACAACASGC